MGWDHSTRSYTDVILERPTMFEKPISARRYVSTTDCLNYEVFECPRCGKYRAQDWIVPLAHDVCLARNVVYFCEPLACLELAIRNDKDVLRDKMRAAQLRRKWKTLEKDANTAHVRDKHPRQTKKH